MIGRGFLYGLFAAGVLSLPAVAFEQDEEAFHHFTLSAGAGLTTITGTDASKLDHGGNIQLNGAIVSIATSESRAISCSAIWALREAN